VQVLVFTVGAQCCAVPLTDVVEVMRAQPITAHGVLPLGVLGTTILRGQPTPVVDAGQILRGMSSSGARLLSLKVGARRVALAVDHIVGPSEIAEDALVDAPALVRGNDSVITALGVLDSELIHVLMSVRAVPLDSAVAFETEETLAAGDEGRA
jgi:purine-binding chemotaxis protein CheW